VTSVEIDGAIGTARDADSEARYLEESEVGAGHEHWSDETAGAARMFPSSPEAVNHRSLHSRDVYEEETRQGHSAVVVVPRDCGSPCAGARTGRYTGQKARARGALRTEARCCA
jgi:hypothetical protein